MLSQRSLALALLALTVGCSATTSDNEESSGSALSNTHVTGAKAERLIAAFGNVEAGEHAMGGRVSVDVSDLSCLTSSNANIDENDPLFNVRTTECGFDLANATPSRHEVADAPDTAAVLFDALAALEESLVESATGKSFIAVSTLECAHSSGGDKALECAVTPEQGDPIFVKDAKAARLVQAFALAELTAAGAPASVRASAISCERAKNTNIEESDPLLSVPTTLCTLEVDGVPSTTKLESDPKAVSLAAALEAAGLAPDVAMGKRGVVAEHISCSKGPDVETSCEIVAAP